MAEKISLELKARTITGKKLAELRKQDIIPSVVYGFGGEPTNTQSPAVKTTKVVHTAGKHSPINLTVDGKKHLAIIKTIDIDPAKQTIRHLAFHTIRQNEKIVAEVPIVLSGVGESPAERAGLVVLQALEHLEIRALPANLPESLEVSILDLVEAGDKATIADIKLPEGVEFADHEQSLDLTVASAYEPSALQAANEAAGGDATEETTEGSDEEASEGESDKTEESAETESKE